MRQCSDMGQLITFDMLLDDVLLEIFDFYVNGDMDVVSDLSLKQIVEEWIRLAHVCRRWRSLIFQSPHRLDLQLVCTPKTPARDTLDIWPHLPISIYIFREEPSSSMDNIIAALEHNDRVREIELEDLTNSQLKYITNSAAMQKPFLELTDLNIGIDMFEDDEPRPILPDLFLGGTALRLRYLFLCRVPFPGLPRLLLSATHLVYLHLFDIPPSGYIPPEAMATSLSVLTSLKSFCIHFRCPPPHSALESRQPPPPPTRSILPSLTEIDFTGASKYLEKILARVDAPRLDKICISFFSNQTIFHTPNLFQCISRRPTLRAPKEGRIRIMFGYADITVRFLSQTSDLGLISLKIQCTASEWQLSSLEQVCSSSSPLLSTLEDLYIFEGRWGPTRRQGDFESTLWLDFLHSFVAVKNLYLSEEFVPRVALALQELVGGRTTEVLPTLENIFLEGFQPSKPLHEGIEKFFAARRLTNHPVAVSHWDTVSKREKQWGS